MAEKLRILFVIDELGLGGTEGQLIEVMRRLDRAKFDVLLCCLSGPNSKVKEYIPELPKVKTLLQDVESTYSLSAILALYRLVRFIRSQHVDIVQAYFLKAKFLGVVAGKLAGIKTISCTRDLGIFINVVNALPVKIANMCTDRFLVNSRCIRDYLIREQRIGPDKIDVIPNGVDLTRYRPIRKDEKVEYKRKLNIDPQCIVIGTIASLKPVKGLSDFIRAAALVHEADNKIHFVIVGEGPLRYALREEAAALGVANVITFAGACVDIRPYLSAFDVGVLCSHSEGFSNAILEYMAAGLPIIATAVGGNVEQIRDKETGFLVVSGDYESLAQHIVDITTNEKLRSTMAEAALEYCSENFAMDSMIRRLEDYYFLQA
ncbi:MAG: glycosyltransferase [Candidatus Binatia bacterium]